MLYRAELCPQCSFPLLFLHVPHPAAQIPFLPGCVFVTVPVGSWRTLQQADPSAVSVFHGFSPHGHGTSQIRAGVSGWCRGRFPLEHSHELLGESRRQDSNLRSPAPKAGGLAASQLLAVADATEPAW